MDIIFDSSKVPGGSSVFITHGSKFEYRQIQKNEYLNARGPLLKPIVVSIRGPLNEEGNVVLEYTVESKKETLSSRSRSMNR